MHTNICMHIRICIHAENIDAFACTVPRNLCVIKVLITAHSCMPRMYVNVYACAWSR